MSDPPPYPGVPRWVKVFGIVVIVLVLLLVVGMFVGGGEHGPRRHATSGYAGGQGAHFSVSADRASPEVGRGWS